MALFEMMLRNLLPDSAHYNAMREWAEEKPEPKPGYEGIVESVPECAVVGKGDGAMNARAYLARTVTEMSLVRPLGDVTDEEDDFAETLTASDIALHLSKQGQIGDPVMWDSDEDLRAQAKERAAYRGRAWDMLGILMPLVKREQEARYE